MRFYEFLASIIGVGFFWWLSIVVLGVTSTSAIIFFPLGILPLLFVVAILIFLYANDKIDTLFGSKLRHGITEYPLEVSMVLFGDNYNELKFSDDGRHVVITFPSSCNIDIDEIKSLGDIISYFGGWNYNFFNRDYVRSLNILSKSKNKEDGTQEIVISMPDEIVLTKDYIEHEIKNVGNVFKRNDQGNSCRYLLGVFGERKIVRKDGRLFVYIDREQRVQSFWGQKDIIMSKNQITRNIKNRLWNRVDVKCISIDKKTYCCELIVDY